MSKETITKALVNALKDHAEAASSDGKIKALKRISTHKRRLIVACGGMTGEYLAIWNAARSEAGLVA